MSAESPRHRVGRVPEDKRTEHVFPAGPDEEERFLRPFAVDAGLGESAPSSERGRAEDLELLSLVVAARTPGIHEWLRPERETIIAHARRPRTVVELAAEVRLPLGQVRAIVADMLVDGSLQRCGPSRRLGREDVLHAVLAGLHAL